MKMIRINATIPEELHRQLKAQLARQGWTIQGWVNACALSSLKPEMSIFKKGKK